jgi:hypothetical protein
LERVGVSPDFVIYVRNLNNASDWIDLDISEEEYEMFVSVEDQYENYIP